MHTARSIEVSAESETTATAAKSCHFALSTNLGQVNLRIDLQLPIKIKLLSVFFRSEETSQMTPGYSGEGEMGTEMLSKTVGQGVVLPREVTTARVDGRRKRQASKASRGIEGLPPCLICGESASGLHYGVNSCSACKVGWFTDSHS